MGEKRCLRWYLDLEWIFERLAIEQSFRVFDSRNHPVRLGSMEFLEGHLLPSDRVLDFGCKEGVLTARLATCCRQVVGVDVDAAAIAVARAQVRLPHVSFVEGDGVEYFRARPGEFDVIVLSHVIEHLDDPRTLLTAAVGTCRQVYIEVPDFERTYLNAFRSQLRSRLIYSDRDHVWEFDRRELRELVSASGLEVRDEEARHGMIRFWCDAAPPPDQVSIR